MNIERLNIRTDKYKDLLNGAIALDHEYENIESNNMRYRKI